MANDSESPAKAADFWSKPVSHLSDQMALLGFALSAWRMRATAGARKFGSHVFLHSFVRFFVFSVATRREPHTK